MKRPLVVVALCYGGGLLLAEWFQPPLELLFAVTFAVFAAALVWSRARFHLLWPLLALAGWTNLISRTTPVSPHGLRRVMNDEPALVTVRGTLIETPALRVFERDEQESWRTLAKVGAAELQRGTNWHQVTGDILVSTHGVLDKDFFGGRNVEIAGVLAPPPRPVAPGLFDYRSYLARQGIYFQLKASPIHAWQSLPGGAVSPPWSDRFVNWAQSTLARGLPEADESLRLLWAMTLGWKTALTNEVSEPFMRSGTMHIFAISGLHIALIAGILVSLLRVMQLPRGWCGLIAIPLLWFYTGATGWQSSAVRATVMMTIIVGGWALKRPSDLLNSLAAAAFLILLWEPQQLFQASFQLSFFVVLSIALLLPIFEKVRDRLLAHDPLLPPSLIPRWRRWLNAPLRWLLTGFATSLAAWLGSLPLTANYFHLLSPVTLLANVIIVPLASGALASCLGSLICGGWLPWAGELFNHSAWFWMTAMAKVSQWASSLPGAYRYVSPPPLIGFIVYYGMLVGVLSGWLFARQRRAWSIGALALLVALGGWHWNQTRGQFRLTVLPLNGGHSVHLDAPERRGDWLIDCGNTNAVEFVVKPFLWAQGVNHLPRLLLTHGDLRSIGGAEELKRHFGVDRIFTSAIKFRSPAYRRILDSLGATPDRHSIVNHGDAVDRWRVLHPQPEDKFPQGDDSALVLLGEFHGTRVLLLSDLGRPGQEQLLAREPDLRADIVVTGLPEQTEPLGDALMDAIRPRVVIVADSEFPATKRASPRLRERLAHRDVPVLYTRQAGAITLIIRKSGWELIAMDGTQINSQPGGPNGRVAQ